MSALVRGEALKLRTTRTALGYAIVAVLLTLLFMLAAILAGDPTTTADKRDAIAVGSGTSAIVLLFGVVGATAEIRHRTLAPALLARPDRTALLAARTIAFGVAGLAIAGLMLVVALAVGLPLLAGQAGPGLGGEDLARVVGGGLLATALCAMLGVGVGTLVGNQVAGVVGTVLWLFLVEPLVGTVKAAAERYTIGETSHVVSGGSGGELAWGVALAVLVAWTVLFVGAGALADRRRDVA
jgi:ABC-2 type transport system permease protein